MINMGIVGYGYWGPYLVRNFHEAAETRVLMVSDLKADNLAKVQKRYPTIQTTTQVADIFKNPQIDAVAIATPVFSHYDLCLQALQAGKHVFVEKPLASTSEKALHLVQEAEKRKLVLVVDHTYLFTGAIRKIKEMVGQGRLGHIYYYDSMRINLGLFQHDINVLWDLAVHDLAIMDFLLEKKPVALAATGISHVEKEPENVAYLTCFFDGNLIAHINVNWLAPVKIRKTLLGGDKKMIVYDELEATEKVKVYDKGIVVSKTEEDIYKMLVGYRTGDIHSPQLDTTEALAYEVACFVDSIKKGTPSVADGKAGLRIVHILEAATQSMALKGRPVELDWKKYGL